LKGLGTPEEKSRKNLNNIPGRNNLLPNESIDTSGVGTSIPISGLNITPRQLGGGSSNPPRGEIIYSLMNLKVLQEWVLQEWILQEGSIQSLERFEIKI